MNEKSLIIKLQIWIPLIWNFKHNYYTIIYMELVLKLTTFWLYHIQFLINIFKKATLTQTCWRFPFFTTCLKRKKNKQEENSLRWGKVDDAIICSLLKYQSHADPPLYEIGSNKTVDRLGGVMAELSLDSQRVKCCRWRLR